MFSRDTISERVSSMLARYSFLDRQILSYFDKRLAQAPRDADFALQYVKREARTFADQRMVIAALEFKCSVLWSQLDALYYAYVSPAFAPQGAFRPEPGS
jgi:coenzyme PQQ biosynthesis protein C